MAEIRTLDSSERIKAFTRAYLRDRDHDISIFTTKEGNYGKFLVHSEVICEQSAYFRDILDSDFAPCSDDGTQHIHIRSFDRETVEKALRFMYNDSTHNLIQVSGGLVKAARLFVFAGFLGLKRLLQEIVDIELPPIIAHFKLEDKELIPLEFFMHSWGGVLSKRRWRRIEYSNALIEAWEMMYSYRDKKKDFRILWNDLKGWMGGHGGELADENYQRAVMGTLREMEVMAIMSNEDANLALLVCELFLIAVTAA